MDALEIINLNKSYNHIKILKDVSLSIKEGEIFGLLGPNGAGKTTLIEIIMGFRSRDSGTIKIYGHDIQGKKFHKRLIGYVPQDHLLYDNLTAMDNIKYFASLYNLDKIQFRERLNKLSEFLGLDKQILNKDVSKLSGGQKRRVALAVSLIHDPKLLIMDEPTTGLDPNIRREFWRLILLLNEEGKTIILTTHYMEEADELCDRVAIIDRGVILSIGSPEELKKRYGGSESIILKIKSREMDKALKILEKYSTQKISDDEIKLIGLNESEIPTLRNLLENRMVWVDKFEVRKPTLDDVFINLTGKRLTTQ